MHDAPRFSLIELIRDGVRFRDIVTPGRSTTRWRWTSRWAASTNTVLHVLALAREADVEYPVARFNEVAERVPHLAKVSPAWDGNRQWHIAGCAQRRAASTRS